uniref:Uncharacterized protein LOC100184007 n=1 Tax=Phallusia mammillata TaxID=59560 RepID=A0A6F9DI15_9ASCI|nr:uncharacterized protein LOC100184007 [Phallusia mammillata]
MEVTKLSVDGSRWTSNTLQRSSDQARNVLIKTRARKLRFSESKTSHTTIHDPTVHTTLDDAFTSVMSSLSTCTRQCLKYYRSTEPSTQSRQDQRFCHKYLQPKYTELQRKNPLDRREGLNIVVAPGTYSVTAGSHGDKAHQQTHIVRVGHGETASLDFNI